MYVFTLSGVEILTILALFEKASSSAFFTILSAKESRERVIFHFTELSLNLCLVISSKPKLLILPN